MTYLLPHKPTKRQLQGSTINNSTLQTLVNKYDFIFLLKVFIELSDLISSERLFQITGAWYLKENDAYFFLLTVHR